MDGVGVQMGVNEPVGVAVGVKVNVRVTVLELDGVGVRVGSWVAVKVGAALGWAGFVVTFWRHEMTPTTRASSPNPTKRSFL